MSALEVVLSLATGVFVFLFILSLYRLAQAERTIENFKNKKKP